MNKKVLILGSTGMLGHQVVNYFLNFNKYEVFDISYRTKLRDETIILDIKNKYALEEKILEIKPDYIVNCIGVLIKGSNDIENAIYINAYLPHQLKKIAQKINSKLIHISTDCVFSGEKKESYTEFDEKDGKDIYSKTKALGEVVDDKNVTLRTSIIGLELKHNGESLFHWFMNQSGTINGFTKAIWSGVTTLELAKAIQWAIDKDITGLYHITNNKSINKYELLNLFKKYTKKDIEIIAVDAKEVNKNFIDTRAEMNYIIPSYDVMINEMINFMKNNKIYEQYRVNNISKKR